MERNHLEGRNHYVGRNPWGETFQMERNLSIGPSWSFCVIGIMKSAEHSSLAITAFIPSKLSCYLQMWKKMQLRITNFTFHLVGSNFIISTRVGSSSGTGTSSPTFSNPSSTIISMIFSVTSVMSPSTALFLATESWNKRLLYLWWYKFFQLFVWEK